jgi:hypothetical protein
MNWTVCWDVPCWAYRFFVSFFVLHNRWGMTQGDSIVALVDVLLQNVNVNVNVYV